MSGRGPKDTRSHRRRTLRILVDHRSSQGVHCDYATTLGAGGMFLETDLPLSIGDVLKLRFRLPRGEELHELEGRVKWIQQRSQPGGPVHSGGVGLQFDDPLAAARIARELEDLG